MILIGDILVPCEKIERIASIDAINQTKANSTILFAYSETLMQYCHKNQIPYGVEVQTLKEAIYANALRAKYIICEKKSAALVQKSAQNYLFDSKVLAIIASNDELEEIANNEIDGVIYTSVLA